MRLVALTHWLTVTLLTITSVRLNADERTFEPSRWQARVASLTKSLEAAPDDVDLLSSRGDAYFFLGQFDASAGDYDRMVQLDESRDASHWRRGIAWFYAGEFEKAAGQFERYHSFDNVDRENGIWRYLCQVKAHGVETAEQGLLKYEKDDREPFGDVYRLFSGDIAPETILTRIKMADIADGEREKRLFYANLYIGLWHAVHDRPGEAQPFLHNAVNNTWAPTAGYGPHYMWHVGRVHHNLISKEQYD
ncbi:MAG: hypothetical protein KDA93_09140 [Planctomycetaceae bacterium]|nr:hypothetical protein [Planctomycetaceae bacterium]